MMCTSGQNPGCSAHLEVGHWNPQCAGNGQLGQRLALDAFYFVHNEAEAIAQVYDGSGYTFTLLAGKYQAGCFAVDTDAQTVHFQFRLLFGNQWTDFQHVCLQDGALFSVEVQRIVFEEGAPLRHALTHHPSGTV